MNKTSILRSFTILAIVAVGFCTSGSAQQKFSYKLTLEDVIRLAQEQSPNAIAAKHTFRASYWQYRSYKAEFLPSLVLRGDFPSFSKQIREIDETIGGQTVKTLSSDFSNTIRGELSLIQNVPFTGGQLAVSSSLKRFDRFLDNLDNHVSMSYISTPISVSYTQSIFGVNTFKWDKKIEPLRYEEAKRSYLSQMEDVSIQAIRYFFTLAAAQQDLKTAEFNYNNNDTLYKISSGRYNIGTIGENDLLQAELAFMRAQSSVNESKYALGSAQNRLRSFLGFNEQVTIEIILPKNVPAVTLDVEKVMLLAKQNNPTMISTQRRLIEQEQKVATARASRGFQADLRMSFGLNQQGDNLTDAYAAPLDMETVGITLSIPILDWGRGKGRVKMAKSGQDLERTKVEQELVDFEQNILLKVQQFNMQGAQYKIASRADSVSQLRYDVTKKRYLIDKVTFTDMNNAQTDRDNSTSKFVSELSNYWNYYYTLRQIALYDFINDKTLSVDFESIVK